MCEEGIIDKQPFPASEMRYTAPAAWGRSFSLPTREGTDTPAQAALNNKQIE